MAAHQGRQMVGRVLDAFVFGALAAVVVLLPGPRRGFDILLLLAIAGWGYLYAARGLLSRAVGVLAFVTGWFSYPVAGLLALWLVAFYVRRSRSAPAPETNAKAGLARLALRTALDTPGRIRGFRSPFESRLGSGEIPLLMVDVSGEIGFYLEPGDWDERARSRFFEWIARLRGSERATLRVEVRGAKSVPADIQEACRSSPERLQELVGRAPRPGGPAR
jgi:hypothetical protein